MSARRTLSIRAPSTTFRETHLTRAISWRIILQFQFHRALCEIAGNEGPIHRCSIYGSQAAGERLNEMLELGRSRPWPVALEALTGSSEMDATAMLDYFAPLQAWLDEQNQGRQCGW